MQEILLINPIEDFNPKVRGKVMARSAKQKAATRKLVAFNKAKRKHNPVKKHKKHSRKSVAKHSARHVSRRGRRSNPIKLPKLGGLGTAANNVLMPAAIGAVGAIGMDMILPYIPLPATMMTGNKKYALKAVIAIGLGMLAGKVIGKEKGHAAGVGMLTVVLHDALKENIPVYAPSIKLAGVNEYVDGLGYYSPSMVVDGFDDGMGEYVAGGSSQWDSSDGFDGFDD